MYKAIFWIAAILLDAVLIALWYFFGKHVPAYIIAVSVGAILALEYSIAKNSVRK